VQFEEACGIDISEHFSPCLNVLSSYNRTLLHHIWRFLILPDRVGRVVSSVQIPVRANTCV